MTLVLPERDDGTDSRFPRGGLTISFDQMRGGASGESKRRGRRGNRDWNVKNNLIKLKKYFSNSQQIEHMPKKERSAKC